MSYRDEYRRLDEPYYKKERKLKSKRVQGDSVYFFILSNIVSLVVFFILAFNLDIFNSTVVTISDMISFDFGRLLLMIFGLMLVSGIVGRIMAYITIRLIAHYYMGRETKKIGEFISGINGISFSYFFSTLISAILFAIGGLKVIQEKIFGEVTIITLIFTYVIVKIIVFLISRLFSSWKL